MEASENTIRSQQLLKVSNCINQTNKKTNFIIHATARRKILV